jgi:hypothetical protein
VSGAAARPVVCHDSGNDGASRLNAVAVDSRDAREKKEHCQLL